MRKAIVIALFILSILTIISEPEVLTIKIVAVKTFSMVYAVLFCKANKLIDR